MDLGAGLLNPVRPGEAEVEKAVLHVGGNFLGAKQADFERGIVDGGTVGAGVGGDAEARAPEEFQRRFLKAAGGQADVEGFHG